MNNVLRAHEVIKQLHAAGEHISKETIITASLFTTGGTLTEADYADIMDAIWQVKDRIAAKVSRTNCEGSYVSGFAEALAVNAYFKN